MAAGDTLRRRPEAGAGGGRLEDGARGGSQRGRRSGRQSARAPALSPTGEFSWVRCGASSDGGGSFSKAASFLRLQAEISEEMQTGEVCGRAVTVVDTPGLFDTSHSNEEVQQEIMRCFELSAPGPHMFLLVIAVGPITQEERETLQLIKMTFGQKAEAYTMVLFTRGDDLTDQSIEDYIKEGDPHVQKLIHDCGGRFHVFNNKQKDPDQVESLLKKINKMMWSNKQTFYNDKMFQEAERAFRLMQNNREREEESRRQMEAIKAKYESEIKEMKEKLEEEKAKKKAMEECNQKMEEIKRKYKEIEEIHAAELKKLKERNSDNITAWNKTHGNCVLL
ncbi:GTPase IMAP family member 7-like [Megalobrama amblycephala]|uniref:GTPase IMAP family member 7-like n=1 Tax=Megalobrama amblycephala TaxID=75352 RepID=UPI002013C697|nr:GTPase IMAP family member 7-like [Megalobrama amblycephala]